LRAIAAVLLARKRRISTAPGVCDHVPLLLGVRKAGPTERTCPAGFGFKKKLGGGLWGRVTNYRGNEFQLKEALACDRKKVFDKRSVAGKRKKGSHDEGWGKGNRKEDERT